MIQRTVPAMLNGHRVETLVGRGYVPELVSPAPLGNYLPGIYHVPNPMGPNPYKGQEPFVLRMLAAFDLVLAPILNSLDNIDAYFDPMLAPADFLEWLGGWVGLVSDENWPLERRREFISQASALYRIRGTPKGLASHVQIFTGGEVQIMERGSTNWSTESGAKLPGSPGFDMIVRVIVDDPSQVDVARLDAIVAAAKPAHLAHKVDVVSRTAEPATPPIPESPVVAESTSDDSQPDGTSADGEGQRTS